MRRVRVFVGLTALGALMSAGGWASAQPALQPYTGVDWEMAPGPGPAPAPDAPVLGGIFSVYTGVATGAGTLVLLDASPPVRDDLVTFDLVAEQINPYAALAGGVQRNVTETVTNDPGLTQTLSVRIDGTTPAGSPADLWPSGLAASGNPLTSGALGLGLNLGAALGNDPFDFVGSTITAANIVIRQDGVDLAPINIPLNFFSPSASNWNGILGLSLPNGATGTTVESSLTFNITYAIPEPASLGLASLAGVGLLLRPRRGIR